MMKTKLILDKNAIVHDRDEWLEHVAGIVPDFSDDPMTLIQALKDREEIGSTRLAEKLVMPHVVMPAIADSYIIVSQLESSVEWFDNHSVDTGTFLIVKGNDELISNFVVHMADDSFIEQLSGRGIEKKTIESLLEE
ncbi:PTS sugar transporter subunit IIA [Limosilactobacillus sp. WILCCON 0053]|uniref:PTS sugar transporter subunit IIA n=1 Tax=Limosilactobacillus allomucosae TaxID=3142938 RepID=A0ABV0I7C9_9LACO